MSTQVGLIFAKDAFTIPTGDIYRKQPGLKKANIATLRHCADIAKTNSTFAKKSKISISDKF